MSQRYSNIPVHPDYSGLQVAPNAADSTLEVVPGEEKIFEDKNLPSYEAVKQDDNVCEPASAAVPQEPEITTVKQKKKWPRKYYTIGAITLIIVILAATLGGYFGSRKKNQSDESDSSTNTNTTSTTPSSDPTSLSTNASLAAIAWNNLDDKYIMYTLFASKDGSLAFSMSSGSTSSEDSDRTKAEFLTPEYTVAKNTPIAITQFRDTKNLVETYQLESFYLNESGRINGENHAQERGWIHDGINARGYEALSESDLSAYWPYVLYQTVQLSLGLVYWTGTFEYQAMAYSAARGSQLAIVPTTRNYSKMAMPIGRVAMFYQDDKDKLVGVDNPFRKSNNQDSNTTEVAWDSEFPDITLPKKGRFEVFSVASNDDSKMDTVDTFVLYMDGSSKIQQVWWNATESKWRTSTPDAFQDIDVGSKIACVTPPIWWINSKNNLPLASASELTRCFFQKGSRLMETQLDGVGWKAPIEIPLSGTNASR